VWIDLLGLAAVGSPVGYVCDDRGRSLPIEEIRRVTNAADLDEVTKLIAGILEKGAASRDRAGRLYNRRMVREAALAAKRRLNGALGGERTKLKWKAFNDLVQLPPQQTLRREISPLILSKKITSTESGATSEGVSRAEESAAAMRERLRKRKHWVR
jgi:hypothetical protein